MNSQQRSESGQAIIILAFAIIAVAALVGLAIDGGRLYSQRRQVQNAADAAALAGTRELANFIAQCAPGNAQQNGMVMNAVLEYARLNGVDEFDVNGDVTAWYVNKDGTNVGYVRNDVDIPQSATGVSTRMVMTDSTTFMKMLGRDSLVAAGEATAMAGPVTQFAGGLLPIAVPEMVIDGMGQGTSFHMFDNRGEFCRDYDNLCFREDGENAPMAQRGWLNLGHIFNQVYWDDPKPPNRAINNNMGANPCAFFPDGSVDVLHTGLSGWASPDCVYPNPIYRGSKGTLGGDFIAGLTGGNTNAMHEIDDSYSTGDIVILPVFDFIYSGKACDEDEVCMDTVFPGKEPDIGWFSGETGYYYHIIGYTAVELGDVSSGGDKFIAGKFVKAVIGEGLVDPSDGIRNGCSAEPEVMGINLWR